MPLEGKPNARGEVAGHRTTETPEQDRELVTTLARGQVSGAPERGHHRGDDAQHVIADRVAVVVVDGLARTELKPQAPWGRGHLDHESARCICSEAHRMKRSQVNGQTRRGEVKDPRANPSSKVTHPTNLHNPANRAKASEALDGPL